MSPAFDFEAVVVGAGAVGLACGRALARRGLSVAESADVQTREDDDTA